MTPRKLFANLVLFLVVMMALAHVVGEWGFGLALIWPLGIGGSE